MKKFLVIGLLALGLTALSQQQASAWYRINFSAGLNFSFESGNNSFLWGLFTNGQSPGGITDAAPWGHPWGYHPYPVYYAYPVYVSSPAPYYAASHGSHHYQTAEPPRHKEPAQTSWHYNGNYQAVGYSYPAANYGYQIPNYYPSSGYYGSYQVPSYWYGY